MISLDYIKKYLIENKIVFPTGIHDGGQSGFQNYGPIGLKIKNKIIDTWRKYFIKQNIFEIDAPVISNELVLTRSGHIQKFNDLGIIFICKKTNKIISIQRADHFIEDKINELGLKNISYKEDQQFIIDFLESNCLYVKENEYYQIKPISLMFKIDNMSDVNLYLRPEVAQTIFIEFKQFYEFNNSKLPFGIAQVGKSYRNEISDKPFVRLREFTQAEVEYFYNPFDQINYQIPLEMQSQKCLILSAQMQLSNKSEQEILLTELGNFVSNPILQMFIIYLYNFAKDIGLDINKLRFRQHKSDEMAHYSKDCWDLEANILDKWLEITGIADRGDYDLKVHDKNNTFKVKKSNTYKLYYKLIPKAKEIFKYNDKQKAMEILQSNSGKIIESKEQLDKINLDWYNVEEFKYYEQIYPNVIEPSIGIDRVFYSLIVHNLSIRPDGLRPYLVLPRQIQPYDFALFQLSSHSVLLNKLNCFMERLTSYNIFTDLSSTTIGKRYTRADELGIHYSITIDFETVKDDTVTIRNLIDMSQIRIHIDEISNYIKK